MLLVWHIKDPVIGISSTNVTLKKTFNGWKCKELGIFSPKIYIMWINCRDQVWLMTLKKLFEAWRFGSRAKQPLWTPPQKKKKACPLIAHCQCLLRSRLQRNQGHKGPLRCKCLFSLICEKFVGIKQEKEFSKNLWKVLGIKQEKKCSKNLWNVLGIKLVRFPNCIVYIYYYQSRDWGTWLGYLSQRRLIHTIINHIKGSQKYSLNLWIKFENYPLYEQALYDQGLFGNLKLADKNYLGSEGLW